MYLEGIKWSRLDHLFQEGVHDSTHWLMLKGRAPHETVVLAFGPRAMYREAVKVKFTQICSG